MAQTKSNANRTAKAATERTGIDHQIRQVEGGWEAYVPTELRPIASTQREAFEEYVRDVAAGLNLDKLPEDVLEKKEARTMLEDGFRNWRASGLVAKEIQGWLRQDDAGEGDEADFSADKALIANAALVSEPAGEKPAGLRAAAQAVLDAWMNEKNRESDMTGALEGPMQALRDALAGSARGSTSKLATPRTGTKQEKVMAMLRATGGATVPEIGEATGWQTHTVRGFLAAIKKKGTTVTATKSDRGPQRITVYAIDIRPGQASR